MLRQDEETRSLLEQQAAAERQRQIQRERDFIESQVPRATRDNQSVNDTIRAHAFSKRHRGTRYVDEDELEARARARKAGPGDRPLHGALSAWVEAPENLAKAMLLPDASSDGGGLLGGGGVGLGGGGTDGNAVDGGGGDAGAASLLVLDLDFDALNNRERDGHGVVAGAGPRSGGGAGGSPSSPVMPQGSGQGPGPGHRAPAVNTVTAGPGARLFGYPTSPVRRLPQAANATPSSHRPSAQASLAGAGGSEDPSLKEGENEDESVADGAGDDKTDDGSANGSFHLEEDLDQMVGGRPMRKPRQEEQLPRRERERKKFPLWTT